MGRAYLDLFKLIICIFVFKSVTENMRFSSKYTTPPVKMIDGRWAGLSV